MREFKPDTRKTTYRTLSTQKLTPPKIVFSTTALKWIEALMTEHDTEIGFYAMVDVRAEKEYYIYDVFYPKHELVNHGTCEISPEGETEIMEYLISKERTDDIAKIRFWGHKHPGSGATGPSGQDETQAIERMNSTGAFLIRAICSGDEISISFFDYEEQIRFDNIKWEIEESDSDAIMVDKLTRVQEVFAEAVTEENAQKHFVDIATILSVDDEMVKIKAKVKTLKKVNVPDEDKTFNGFRPGYQVNDYRKHNTGYGGNRSGSGFGGGRGRNGSHQMSLLPNTSIATDNNDTLDPNEVAILLDEVDQELDDFYGGQFL